MQALDNRLDQPRTTAERMRAFLADFKATCRFYRDLSVRMQQRIDDALALDPVPGCLERSFVVFERHCADEGLEPKSVEALNFLIMLPG